MSGLSLLLELHQALIFRELTDNVIVKLPQNFHVEIDVP